MRINILNNLDVEVFEDSFTHVDKVTHTLESCCINHEGDPFMLCDLGDVFIKHKRFLGTLPRVQPFYAVKCNPNPYVVQFLAKLGAGFDCASKSEIQQVLSYGIPQSKIIYANPCKQASHILYSKSHEVDLMTFDSMQELHKIHHLYPTARLVLRIATDTSKAKIPLSLKFGAQQADIMNIVTLCAQLGVNLVGVSFHVGSSCTDSSAYWDAIRSARAVFEAATELGLKPLTLLDIGGGFPGAKGKEALFDDMCRCINEALDEFFPVSENGTSSVEIIAEPGRYYVASAFTSVCSVTSVHSRSSSSPSTAGTPEALSYYLNDGVYGSFIFVVLDSATELVARVLKFSEGDSDCYLSTLWGPTCDSVDKIMDSVMLPKLSEGDWLYFENMGAYTSSCTTNFNGFGQLQVYFCISKSVLAENPYLFESLMESCGINVEEFQAQLVEPSPAC